MRRHGQEGQQGAGAEHAEHVAEVGAGPHADVLDDVGEDLAALEHAFLQDHQALFEQDHVGGFLGDVHGGIDGDAHVGGAQGGGVVDAVAHEADDVAAALQRLDDALLVAGREPGEDGRRSAASASCSSVIVSTSPPRRCGRRQADLVADLAGDQFVVAGEHLDRDAVLLQRGDRRPRRSPWAGRGKPRSL